MGKIYISGGITGVPDYMERFSYAEKILNYVHPGKVVNPAKVLAMLPEESMTWGEYMNISLEILKLCDTVYMLPGWIHSKGARLEYAYAKNAGYEIIESRLAWN